MAEGSTEEVEWRRLGPRALLAFVLVDAAPCPLRRCSSPEHRQWPGMAVCRPPDPFLQLSPQTLLPGSLAELTATHLESAAATEKKSLSKREM